MNYIANSHKLLQMKQVINTIIKEKNNIKADLSKQQHHQLLNLQLMVPDQCLFDELTGYTKQLNNRIEQIYKRSGGTLKQIERVKHKKQNVSRLMDTVTSILQIKRISYGLGNNNQDLHRNIKIFYEIKDKAVYCKKYIVQIQNQIGKIKQKYKQEFDKELKQSNSNNLAHYSKILSLIPDKNEQNNNNQNQFKSSLQKLILIYSNNLGKQFLIIQEQLFKIPITGVIQKQYGFIFFDIVKTTLKIFVNSLKISKNNTFKLHQQEGVHKLITSLILKNLNPILAQIFKRLQKYFQIQKIPFNSEKMILKDKDILRIQHFCSQYRSICNQIQRLIMYIKQNTVNQTYASYTDFTNQVNQSINSQTLIQMNNNLISYSEALLRHQLNQLIKKSVFITSLWKLQSDFISSAQKNSLIQVPAMHDFLDQMFLIFEKGIQDACSSLNRLVISSIINYLSNHLIYQDSFFIFSQIFKKHVLKISNNHTLQQSAIILVLNALANYPTYFQSLLKQIKILQVQDLHFVDKIKLELEQLQSHNSHRSKQLLKQYIRHLCGLSHFKLSFQSQNYKILVKIYNNENKLHKQAFDILIEIMSESHANSIIQNNFNNSTKKFDSFSILSLQKQIRGAIKFYEQISTVHVLQKFRLVLIYCGVVMLETQQQVSKFLRQIPSTIDVREVREVFENNRKK